jgi:hypothetical protein
VDYGLEVRRNESLAMLGAFDDVIRRFRAAERANELFNHGTNELRLTPAPIRRALELRLFGECHPQTPEGWDELYEIGDALKDL